MTAPEGGSLDLKKIERDLELLIILLGSHGINLNDADDILITKEKVYA